jgi:hypothetical protein
MRRGAAIPGIKTSREGKKYLMARQTPKTKTAKRKEKKEPSNFFVSREKGDFLM